MARGGKRPGSGPKKGSKFGPHQSTITKAEARDAVRAMVIAKLAPMVDAQIEHAQGLKYLVTRDKKTGKFIRVGPAMAGQVGEETIEVWEKDPSVQAFTDLLNRALDKPIEAVEVSGKDGQPLIVGWEK